MNKLPDNYADKVMQCEVILEANPDMQNLKALNELYGVIYLLLRLASAIILTSSRSKPATSRRKWQPFFPGLTFLRYCRKMQGKSLTNLTL